MSLDMSRTKFEITGERPLSAGITQLVEGQALVSDFSGTEEKAAIADGTAGQKFLGVAIVQYVNVTELPVVETVTAPTVSPAAAVAITLSHAAVQASTLVVYDGATPLDAGAPGAANSEYSVSGNVVTVGGALMGKPLTFMYVYNPTVNEVMARFHQAALNYDNQNAVYGQASVGGGMGAEIFTDCWDPTNGRFTLGGVVKLAANGKFSAGGAGPTVGVCIKLPLTNDSYLGFRITEPNTI